MAKLWTGKTARQELVGFARSALATRRCTVGESIEFAIGDAEYLPRASPSREAMEWCEAANSFREHDGSSDMPKWMICEK